MIEYEEHDFKFNLPQGFENRVNYDFVNSSKDHENIKLGQYTVKFPMNPYDIQCQYMANVLEACDKKQNALLESPTGTGKTLALLWASLEWLYQQRVTENGDPNSIIHSLAYLESCKKAGESADKEYQEYIKQYRFCKIIYTSRTQSQLKQVISELRSTVYEPKTVLLGSRDHLCLNPKLKDKKGTDLREACRSCRKNWEFYDIHKIKDYANKEALTSFAHIEDIEDLRLHGKRKKICPYYLQQNRHKYADLILMPYNYIVDPKIRENFEIKFENSIIIIDEGHNITDVCESSASCQIDTSMLWATNTELEKLMNKISDYNSFKTEHYKIFKNIFNSNDSQINYDLVTTHQEWKKLKNIVWKMALNLENFSKESYLDEHIMQEIDTVFDVFQDLSKKVEVKESDNIDTDIKNYNRYNAEINIENIDSVVRSFEDALRDFTIDYDPLYELLEDKTKSPRNIYDPNDEVWEEDAQSDIQEKKKIQKYKQEIMMDEFLRVLRLLKDIKHNIFENKRERDLINNLVYHIEEREYEEDKNEWNDDDKPKYEVRKEVSKDFKLWLYKEKNYEQRNAERIWLGIWCFNPGYIFKQLTKLDIRSIIVTSGTLAPMESFESELQTKFPIKLQNDHVIDLNQLNIGVARKGIMDSSFLFVYQNREDQSMIVDAGKSILKLIEITPDGVLIFFPSYNLMQKAHKIWEDYGILDKIKRIKEYFSEPKNSSELDSVRMQYQEAIENGEGAILAGVCKGKISEGLDFSDRAARLWIIIGIPYAPIMDPRVVIKKDYVDFQKQNGLSAINGNKWYNQQAARAVNQAIGRVIRHVNDYGAIVLFDTRYKDEGKKKERSKWLRDRQQTFIEFSDAVESLSTFFEHMESNPERPEPLLYDPDKDYLALVSSDIKVKKVPKKSDVPKVAKKVIKVPQIINSEKDISKILPTLEEASVYIFNDLKEDYLDNDAFENLVRLIDQVKSTKMDKSKANKKARSILQSSTIEKEKMNKAAKMFRSIYDNEVQD